ncbi:uncharacterized protein ACRADG_010581 isoform 1-T4 [Cochliomyia hominivorax]
MEITPGRAMYSPDEELKPLRLPKTYHPEPVAQPSTLSIYAAEFVPRYGNVMPHNVQERLQKHQKQYIQQNYHQYQQQPQQQEQQQQQQHYQQSYSNGYGNQQQQQQKQQQQQYQQSSQNLNAQMGSMNISSVQDRLRNTNNVGGRVGGGGGGYYQQQRGGQQGDYQQNNHYRYNKNHHNQQQQQHHHNPHQHRYNNHHNQHHQQQYHQQNQQQSKVSAVPESANDMENIALDYLQTVIQCLNQNPGQFDSIATRFITIFEGMENNHYVLSIAMEDIFDESIKNPNFRYMGAKLYNLLHMLNPSKDSLFHTLLKYKLDFHQQQVREYMQKKQEAKVRETALFLAELYMQLRGDDSRIYLIAENIVFSLKELLSMEDNKDNIRCICLTLKLAGYDLTSDCANDMKEIIAKLDAINCQNPGKYPLANNVISLQKNNWGRKTVNPDSPAEPEKPKKVEPLRVSDDPVFYGPDGREITAEECEFLTNGAAGTAASSDNEDENDDLDLDPEMDEETERDFKLFLKQSNNKS